MSTDRNAYFRGYHATLNGKARRLLYMARHRAQKANIPFDLTYEWVEAELRSALDNGCPYLGIPIRLDGGINDPHCPSIDQFYPGAGYTQDNCIIVSYQANRMKSNAQPATVERLGENVAKLRVSRFQKNPDPLASDDPHVVT